MSDVWSHALKLLTKPCTFSKLFKATHSSLPEIVIYTGVNWSLYGGWTGEWSTLMITLISVSTVPEEKEDPPAVHTPILHNSKLSKHGFSNLFFCFHQHYWHYKSQLFTASFHFQVKLRKLWKSFIHLSNNFLMKDYHSLLHENPHRSQQLGSITIILITSCLQGPLNSGR